MTMKFQTGCLVLLIALLHGCSKKDKDYEVYLQGGEHVYPGVVANTGFRPGDQRVLLTWNPSPDPSIAKYVIYWNNRQDSMTVNATSHSPADTVKTLVTGLKEYVYAFSIYSYDTKGHVSIAITLNNVKVYGPVYRGGLLNRPYNATTPYSFTSAGTVILNFNTPDTINITTIIRYTNNSGVQKDTSLSPAKNTIGLPDYQFGTTVQYRSAYIPVNGAIDTFNTPAFDNFPDIKLLGNVTPLFIKNPGTPFVRSDNGTGKWGLPKDWLYNTNVLNQNGNTAGGWSTDGSPSGVIHFESKDWSGPGVTNGKIYQTFTLPAGSYTAQFTSDGGGSGSFIDGNFVVAAGTTLPDISALSGALGLAHWDQNNVGGTHSFTFTLNASTVVAIGWVVSTGTTSWNHINSITLTKTS